MLCMMLLLILVPIPNQSGMYSSIEYPTEFSSPVVKTALAYTRYLENCTPGLREPSDVSTQKIES